MENRSYDTNVYESFEALKKTILKDFSDIDAQRIINSYIYLLLSR